MSDRVAVMSRGTIQQIADPSTIYDKPATPFVASFVGENNPFFGRVAATGEDSAVVETPIGRLRGGNGHGLRVGDEAILFVRPERLSLVGAGADGENIIESEVSHASFEGSFAHIFLAGAEGRDIIVNAVNDGSMPRLPAGSRARVRFMAEDAVVLPRGELARD
jgi:spermidine/putrescine transport system ATP-binding protein